MNCIYSLILDKRTKTQYQRKAFGLQLGAILLDQLGFLVSSKSIVET